MITLESGKSSMSLLYISIGKVAVTNRYWAVIGEAFIKHCNASSKSSSLKSISTSSNTALSTNHNNLFKLVMKSCQFPNNSIHEKWKNQKQLFNLIDKQDYLKQLIKNSKSP